MNQNPFSRIYNELVDAFELEDVQRTIAGVLGARARVEREPLSNPYSVHTSTPRWTFTHSEVSDVFSDRQTMTSGRKRTIRYRRHHMEVVATLIWDQSGDQCAAWQRERLISEIWPLLLPFTDRRSGASLAMAVPLDESDVGVPAYRALEFMIELEAIDRNPPPQEG